MGDFLAFRRMLLPVLIQLIFWLLVLACIGVGLGILFDKVPDMGTKLQEQADRDPLKSAGLSVDTLKAIVGLTFCLVGPILIRLFCEVLILPFRINGTLTDIRTAMLAVQEAAERDRPAAHHPLTPPAAPRSAPPPRR
jgi:hypothetical protein